MPAPDSAADVAARWFGLPSTAEALAAEQAELIPQIAAQIGVRGLYLRPAAVVARELSGNMLQSLTVLHRTQQGWQGDLRCATGPLPLGSESFSLVYLLHVLELVAEPELLLRECARCLQPEGLLVALVFNPWSPFRCRWPEQGMRPLSAGAVERIIGQAGLSIEQRIGVGCLWRSRREASAARDSRLRAAVGPLLSSQALIARKRRIAPTMVGPARAQLRARATPS